MTLAKQALIDERNSIRVTTLRLGVIETAGSQQHFHLLDLSRTGAHAYCSAPPPVESLVSLTCGSMVRPGKVVWANRHHIGIVFSDPVDERTIDEVFGSPVRGLAA